MRKVSLFINAFEPNYVSHYTVYDIVDSKSGWMPPTKGKEILLDYDVRKINGIWQNDNKLKDFLLKNKYEDEKVTYSKEYKEMMDTIKNHNRNKYIVVRITGNYSGMFNGFTFYKKK